MIHRYCFEYVYELKTHQRINLQDKKPMMNRLGIVQISRGDSSSTESPKKLILIR